MNWLLTIAVGILTAVAGGFGGWYLGMLYVKWHRVGGFEGAMGYTVIFASLVGILGGLVVGIVASRVVAGWADANFLKGLGAAFGSLVLLLVAVGGLFYLSAEFPPLLDGKALAVEAELRFPAGVEVPASQGDDWTWYASLSANAGKRRQLSERLDLARRRKEDGRWIVPVRIPLDTVVADKSLAVSWPDAGAQYAAINVPGRPKSVNEDWSAWAPATCTGDLKPVPAHTAVAVRTRVRFAQD